MHSDSHFSHSSKQPAVISCVEDGYCRLPQEEEGVPERIISSVKDNFGFYLKDWFLRHSEEGGMMFDATRGEFPDHKNTSSLIISGSYHMIDDKYLWISNLKKYIALCIESEIPILGICFGHQLLAHMLGGTVEELDSYDVGLKTIRINEHAEEDWLFDGMPKSFETLFSRRQAVVDAPKDVVRLDEDSEYIDMFKYQNVRGIQFHPEINAEILIYLSYVREKKLLKDNVDPKALRKTVRQYNPNHCSQIIRNFMSYQPLH